MGLPFKARSSGCKTTRVEMYGNYSKKYQILRMLGPIFMPDLGQKWQKY